MGTEEVDVKVHNLTEKEAKKISEMYGLGAVKRIEKINTGLVNSNYDIKTLRGNFIVRFIGAEISDYKKKKLQLENDVLLYLKRINFPYKIPFPLKNNLGEYHSTINRKLFWVYEKIEGESVRVLNDKQLMNVARVLANYHKYIRGFKIDLSERDIFSLQWVQDRYKELANVQPKTKIDKLMKDNFDFFNNLLQDLAKKDFKTNLIIIHSDVHGRNLLFKKDKVVAVLDFDNLQIGPRINDVAYTIKQTCCFNNNLNRDKMELFLSEYEKIIRLTKKEKEMIIPLIIRDNCIVFWWFYAEMKKKLDKKYVLLKWTIDLTKNLVKGLK